MNDLSYTALGTLIGAVISAVVWGVIKIMGARHQLRAEDRREFSQEYQRLLTRYDNDYLELKGELAGVREDLKTVSEALAEEKGRTADCERRWDRALIWIRIVEKTLRERRVPFEPFNPDPDSDEAKSPQPGQQNTKGGRP